MSAKVGISVSKSRVGFEPSYDCGAVNVPWIAVPCEVMDATPFAVTWSTKYGVYGTRTRDSGSIARVAVNRLTARIPRMTSSQPGPKPNHTRLGLSGGVV